MTWIAQSPDGQGNFTFQQGRSYRIVSMISSSVGDDTVRSMLSGPVDTHRLIGAPDTGGFSDVLTWAQDAPLPPDWPDHRAPASGDWRVVYLQATRTGKTDTMPTSYTFVGHGYRLLSVFMDSGGAPVTPPHPPLPVPGRPAPAPAPAAQPMPVPAAPPQPGPPPAPVWQPEVDETPPDKRVAIGFGLAAGCLLVAIAAGSGRR